MAGTYAKYSGPIGGGGGGGGGITSINGDSTAAQVIAAGSGISVVSSGGTTTVSNTATAGANTALSNLIPTSINQSLTFGVDDSLDIGAVSSGRPAHVYVSEALLTPLVISYFGTDLTVQAPDGSNSSGNSINILAGNGDGASGDGGSLTVAAGTGRLGGTLALASGGGSNAAGDITVNAGNSGASSVGGNVFVTSGQGQTGGVIQLAAQSGGSGGSGGAVQLISGNGGSLGGGNIQLISGDGNGAIAGEIQLQLGTGVPHGQVRIIGASGANLVWDTNAAGNIGAGGGANSPHNIFVSNQVLGPVANNTNPTYSFDGDSASGMFQDNPGANDLSFSTGGITMVTLAPFQFTLGVDNTTVVTLNMTEVAPDAGVGAITNLPTGVSGNPTNYIKATLNGVPGVIPFWALP